jgi:3-hydroxyacyl-[acyl-carrier-protein] dehydratase
VSFAKFRRPIIPGDIIMLHAKALHVSNKGGKIDAKAMVKDKIAVESELSFALLDKEQL